MHRRDLLKMAALGAPAWDVSMVRPALAASTAETTKHADEALEQSGVKFRLVNALSRVYPNSHPGSAAPLTLVTPRNARVSFQACFRNLLDSSVRVRASLEGNNLYNARVLRVG
jgi:hypothetical protein